MDLLVNSRRRLPVLSTRIDACTWNEVIAQILTWANRRESRYVCICNAHSVVTAAHDQRFHEILDNADFATPDGAPVAWMLRRQGYTDQLRINGPDLMLKVCESAAEAGVSVFLYGAELETLELLQENLRRWYPNLSIAGAISPPFRALSQEEDRAISDQINKSGAGVVWVGLGCPKQETWMHEHKHAVNAVMVGVGAAFDYHAGRIKRAPHWMQDAGLEWLHRLGSEPRRLWRRYLVTNTLFICGAIRQLVRRHGQ
ncbi:WecB/TagA/CpsF family glycosyltransferase [Ramlibacter sp. PS3R-8]|uniref:WecB/TagA/CpsF family glycosyltransferase n=1 Tax=Ramlibacter sp. PS3R-8 TaxID=3133437 RepID=UPI00309CC792